ncbi:MAG: site-specific DNA-methyltransferase [Gemmatimonadota bacterium]|nr:site-specific DNA-methyltransferase [Gemmatimonadota bacterium]
MKAAEHFTDYRYRTRSGVSVRFSVRSANVEQNDVKGKTRFFFPRLGEAVWDAECRTLEVPFDHRLPTAAEAKDLKKNGAQRTVLERAEASVPEALATTPEAAKALLDPWDGHTGDDDAPSLFTHHAERFARKRTSDFFIHRDLRAFLSRELDYFLRSEVLRLRSLVAGGEARADAWIDKVRIIREVGANVIEFLAQIEGFQKMLWEKRKFVVDVQYCVAVGLVPDELRPGILECEAQWDEWRALGCVVEDDGLLADRDESETRRGFLERNPGLLLDTRHFDSEFVVDLLAALDDIDDLTDGVTIRSENWQALNLLGERYREALSCVYIDPPYNTDASAILYKNDYKDSSWLSLMADRLSLSRTLLAPAGILGCAIDDEEVSRLRMLMQNIMPMELGTVVVRSNPAGRKSRGQLSPSHEFALFFGHDRASPGSLKKTEKELARYRFEDEVGRYDWNNLIRHGSNDRREDRPKLFFPIYVSEDDRIRVPQLRWVADESRYEALDGPEEDEVELLPTRSAEGGEVIEKNWHHGPDKIRGNPQLYRVRRKGNAISIDFMIRMDMKAIPKTWWGDPRYASSNRGPRTSKDLFGGKPFDYPKAVGLVEDCLRVGGLDADATTLDYFAGSGTTGHAVINLNREDGGRRKFILVEMGDHFDTVLMPRLKKVAFSPEWKNGRAVRPATQEEAERSPRIIKYFRLESYEDALNNIEFEQPDEDMFAVEDYMLRYMLRWETKGSATLLNVAALERPFDYKLRLNGNADGEDVPVDLPETFNYLLGLAVRTRRVYDDDGRRYLVYAGRTRDKREAVVIWRNTEGWTPEDRERDRDFVETHDMTAGAEDIWMNGDTMVKGARPLDTLFKQRMFASVTD